MSHGSTFHISPLFASRNASGKLPGLSECDFHFLGAGAKWGLRRYIGAWGEPNSRKRFRNCFQETLPDLPGTFRDSVFLTLCVFQCFLTRTNSENNLMNALSFSVYGVYFEPHIYIYIYIYMYIYIHPYICLYIPICSPRVGMRHVANTGRPVHATESEKWPHFEG